MNDTIELKKLVKETYSQIAKQVPHLWKKPMNSSCSSSDGSCC